MMGYVWAAMIVISLIVEAATAQLVAIWFLIPAIAALLLAVFGVDFWIQILVFVVASLLLILFARPILTKLLFKKPVEATNSDRLIGKIGTVTAGIDNLKECGEVKVGGEVWTARSADLSPIPEGSFVIIECIEGVKLICKPADINHK